jgi:hypothetical protein
MKRIELTLVKGGKERLLDRSKQYKKKIIEDSIIGEKRIFNMGEIQGLIEQIAKEEGFNKQDLEIDKEFYDKQGNLIQLGVKVKKSRALAEGWGDIVFDFMIKGNHGKVGFSNETLVSRAYATKDKPTEYVSGGIVAIFKNNRWQLKPGEIAPTAENIFKR